MSPKRFAAATERNREAILEVLREALPKTGTVLEIASGTGQHAVYFARHLPRLTWQPSDVSPEALQSIAAWLTEADLPNTLAPAVVDVRESEWPVEAPAAIVCINMIHITPWSSTVGLFEGASVHLAPGAPLLTYGPYRVHGEHTAPSNAAFDARLRSDNPRWGVRDIDELTALGAERGLSLERTVQMPANNLTLVWRRHGRGP